METNDNKRRLLILHHKVWGSFSDITYHNGTSQNKNHIVRDNTEVYNHEWGNHHADVRPIPAYTSLRTLGAKDFSFTSMTKLHSYRCLLLQWDTIYPCFEKKKSQSLGDFVYPSTAANTADVTACTALNYFLRISLQQMTYRCATASGGE